MQMSCLIVRYVRNVIVLQQVTVYRPITLAVVKERERDRYNATETDANLPLKEMLLGW